jgi:hypothetical protein
MTKQPRGLSIEGDSILDRLREAEETIRQILRDADTMLTLPCIHGVLPCGRTVRAVVCDLTDVALLALAAARYRE